MERFIRKPEMIISLMFLALFLVACSEPEKTEEEITISGEITSINDLNGRTVYISIHHAQSGIGFQQHPLYEIDSFESQSKSFERTFSYDREGNSGLVVYAWIDNDNDGINCTMQSRDDVSGVAVNEDFPNSNNAFVVPLTEKCVGPDWFYPAKQ